MSSLFRLRTADGYVSPCTSLTNCHGTDLKNMLIPEAVAVAILDSKNPLEWRDVVRCVAAGKDPTLLLKNPDAIKPRKELADAPNFEPKAPGLPADAPAAPKVSELALARTENRAPDLSLLTPDELNAQAALVGVDPSGYTTAKGLMRAVQKKMDDAGA